MSELSEDEREAIATAHEHGPEVCDCDAYAPEDGYSPDTICEGLAATFAAVERIIDARTQEAVNAALAPIEALLALYESWQGERDHPGASSPRQRDDLRRALAAARDAAGRSGGEG